MIMSTASGMMEFEGQNNDFGGTKRYNNIPLDQRLKGFGPPKFLWSPFHGSCGSQFLELGHVICLSNFIVAHNFYLP